MFCRLFSKYFCCHLFGWNKPSLAAPLYSFILLFTVIGCNSSPKDFTIDYADSAKIAAPTNFRAKNIGYGEVTLEWRAVAGATGYLINYGTNSNSLNRTKTVGDGDGDVTTDTVGGFDEITYTVGGLAGGTLHYFVVRATNGIAVLMEPSSPVKAFPKFEAPENLEAKLTPKVTGEVTLTWKKLDNATNYIIYYGTKENALDKTQEVGNLITTKVAELIANTTYYFAISAYNSKAAGAKSTAVSATPTGPMLGIPDITAITAKSKTEVDLTWDEVTSDTFTVTGYTVKYSTAGVDKTIDITNSKTLKASVTNLAAGTTYSFFVRADATDDSGSVVAGGYSTAKSVTTWFNAVSGFSAKANTTTAGAVDLSWDKVANAPGYAIRYGTTAAANDGTHDVDNGDSTTDTIIGLTQGTPYHFKIIVAGSINSIAVKGEYNSNEVTATPTTSQAGASSIISILAKSKTQVDLTWDEVTSDTFTVTGLGAKSSSSTAGAIDLTWDAVARAAGYIISYGTAPEGDGVTRDVASRTTYTITGLTQGTPYYFKIAVKGQVSGQDVISDYTDVVSAGAPYSALVNVGLDATWDAVNDKHAIDVTWDSSTSATGYDIYYANTSFDGVTNINLESHATANGGAKIPNVSAGVPRPHELSHRISDLSADKSYYVLVIGTTNNANTVRHPGKSTKTLGIVDLVQGKDHLCALLNTGVVKCWGNNTNRKASASDSASVSKPTTYDVTDDTSQKVTAITAGYQHNCAIVEDNSVYCWGKNADGELGVGSTDSTSSSTKPNKVQANDTGAAFKAKVVQAGVSVTCAVSLDDKNKSYCWGDGTNSGLGVSATDDQTRPQEVATLTSEVAQFALGHQAGCALDVSGNLWCWGDGSGSPSSFGGAANKVSLDADATLDSISSTYQFSCGVTKAADELQCWGINNDGQLGKDSTSKDTKQPPAYVKELTDAGNRLGKVAGVAVGVNHACAWFTDTTQPRCWGRGTERQLGVTASTDSISYAAALNPVSGLGKSSLITKITAGNNTSCALLTDKTTIKCWGDNSHGQFGNGLKTGTALSTVDQDALFSK